MIASLIVILYLLGIVTPAGAWTFLYVYALLLVAGEIAMGGHGLLIFNALLAGWIGFVIQAGSNTLLGLPLDWSLMFGIAFVEATLVIAFIIVTLRYRNLKASTGTEYMIGHKARILTWNGQSGTILISGETWKARSETNMKLAPDEQVTVKAIDGLSAIITN